MLHGGGIVNPPAIMVNVDDLEKLLLGDRIDEEDAVRYELAISKARRANGIRR